MKRFLCSLLLLSVLLTGCAKVLPSVEQKQYNATFLDLFDTVTTIVGKAESEAAFQEKAQAIKAELEKYHKLFDIYNEYEGIVNLKNVNDAAGFASVEVDQSIIDLLLDCQTYYDVTGGMVNVAMGSVLKLWHEARNDSINDPTSAYLPDPELLSAASLHTDMECVIIDEKSSTVFITDPRVRLDVGAIAKGWATQRVAENAPKGLLISVGGNVCATGPKDDSGTPWVVGIQNPGGDNYLHTLYVRSGSVVTSGDYQRYFVVDGKPYHHIIDPVTLQPGTYWRSVTIVCQDSGLADALSTALFLMPQAEGQAILDQFGAQAMWVDAEGNIFYTPGLALLIKS